MDDLTAPLATPASNLPEYSVSEISGAVKRTLEGAFGRVRVRGEITEFKRYSSGHLYFSLKDEGAKLSGVVWKGTVSRLGLVPENGIEVIATGRVSSYADRSSYQLIVERMEYAGAGALLARIEMLRVRLTAEGLFAAERKRRLPVLPGVVGVVTSLQGAVIQDIRTTIARRFPRAILIWPVPVQGPEAAVRIAAAIRGFNALPEGGLIPRPDVLIVARGGGSLEDLMAFNDEAVVRAAAESRIPLISAVGHETDTTLIDFASDRRAPTPTAAAELAVPARSDLIADLAHKTARLAGALTRLTQDGRLRLHHAAAGLPDLVSIVGGARQRLDDRAGRLGRALPNLVAARRAALVRAERGLPDPRSLVTARRGALHVMEVRLLGAFPRGVAARRAALVQVERGLPGPRSLVRERRGGLHVMEVRLRGALPKLVAARRTALVAVERGLPDPRGWVEASRGRVRLLAAQLAAALRHAVQRQQARAGSTLSRLSDVPLRAQLREARARLEGVSARLDSVSHAAVLARGFALVVDPAGHAVTRAAAVRPGARLQVRFADGGVGVTADGRKGAPAAQGRLGL